MSSPPEDSTTKSGQFNNSSLSKSMRNKRPAEGGGAGTERAVLRGENPDEIQSSTSYTNSSKRGKCANDDSSTTTERADDVPSTAHVHHHPSAEEEEEEEESTSACCTILKQVSQNDRDVVYRALKTIADIGYTQDEEDGATAEKYCLEITKANGPLVVVSAMERNPGDAEVQTTACRVLTSLTFFSALGVERTARAGGVRAVIAAMTEFPRNVRLHKNACRTLRNVMLEASPAVVRDVTESGGILALVGSMKAHPASPNIYEDACLILANLVRSGVTDRVTGAIVDIGGLTLIARAAERQQESFQNGDVKRALRAALAALSHPGQSYWHDNNNESSFETI